DSERYPAELIREMVLRSRSRIRLHVMCGAESSIKESQECLLSISWFGRVENIRDTRPRVPRCSRARKSGVFVRGFIRKRLRSRILPCAKLLVYDSPTELKSRRTFLASAT